jgi:hypothetical protein
MQRSSSCAVLLLAATLFPARGLPAGAIDPPVFLPEPGWVNMLGQGGGDPRLAGYFAPHGVKLEIAAEKELFSQTGDMCFAPDGSLLVLEWRPEALADAKQTQETVTYRDGAKRVFTRTATRVKDAVKRVANAGELAAFDQANTVFESELLSCISAQGDWLYTAGSGSVIRHRRSQKAGPFDIHSVVAKGFGGTGPRPAFGLAVDFDGSLLIAVGPGTHDVEGSDGSRAFVQGSGAVFRCRPDGSRMALFAIGLDEPRSGPVSTAISTLFSLICFLIRLAERGACFISPTRATLDFALAWLHSRPWTTVFAEVACADFLESWRRSSRELALRRAGSAFVLTRSFRLSCRDYFSVPIPHGTRCWPSGPNGVTQRLPLRSNST